MCEQGLRIPWCASLRESKNLLEYCELQIKSSDTKIMYCLFPSFSFLPPATKLGQGYVFTRVCVSVNGGGLGLCPGGVSVPQGSGLCPGGCLCHGDPPYGNERAVRILLECILVETLSYLFCRDLSVFHLRLVLTVCCYCPSLSMKIFVMIVDE